MDSVHTALARWVGEVLGVPTEYGEFPPGFGTAMVKASPGDPVVVRYRSGGGVYRLPYEVYLRLAARTEGQRVEGLSTLQRLADAVEAGECPEADGAFWMGHSVTNAPSLFAEEPGAGTVYQLTACLTYRVRG